MKMNLQTLSLPRAIKAEHCVKDIELEGVLPDYSPDISRLVRVDAAPYVEGVSCGEKTEISGKVIFGLLYESDYKSKLAYTTFAVPFTLKCDLPPARESYPDVKCDCTYLTCRLLGQRKVSVKAKIDALVTGTQVDDFTVVRPDDGDLNTFFKTVMLDAQIPVARAEGAAEVKESVRLDAAVASVVYAQAVFAPAQTEAFDTSAAVRADMKVTALCELPDGGYKSFEAKLPVEVSVKNDAINGDSLLDASLECAELSAVADLDEYGENKLLNLRCSVKASATVRQQRTLCLPLDAFSKKNSCKCECAEAVLDVRVPQAGRTISVERTHPSEGDIGEILIASSAFEISEARPTAGALAVKGRVKTEVLAKSGDSVVSRSFSDDFEDSLPYTGSTPPIITDVTVFECRAELYGDTVNIRTMAFVGLCADERRQLSALSSVELGGIDEPEHDGISFYYPDGEETLWDIAKKYRTDPEKLRADNADCLNSEGTLTGRRYLCIK